MTATFIDSLQILFILALGITFGAGLYETRVVLPLWFPPTNGPHRQVDTQAMQTIDSGRQFWAFVSTGPLTLLTLANVWVAWQSVGATRDWWLAAGVVALVERIGTFTFFIPTAIRLQRAATLPADRVSRLISRWSGANYVRSLLTLLAWLLALKVLAA